MKIIPINVLKQPQTNNEFIKWIKTFLNDNNIKHPFQAEEKPYLVCKVIIETDMDVPLLLQFTPKSETDED